MAATNYAGTLTSPVCTDGFFMRPETKVRIGTAQLWATGGLWNTTGGSDRAYIYDTYAASIGLQTGEGLTLGCLNALSFSYEPDRQPVEVVNIADAPAYELVGEECTVTIELLQWDADVIAVVFGSGQYHTVTGNDALVRFGGGCATATRPVVIEGVNVSCNIGDITALANGLSAFVLTLYNCTCTSGFQADFTASENTAISTEWQVLPVTALEAGNRLGNLYMFASA
jgi:hypothetical protein